MAKYFGCALAGAVSMFIWVGWSMDQHIRSWWWLPLQASVALALFAGGIVFGLWWGTQEETDADHRD